MSGNLLVSLAAIVVVGVLAQLIAHRCRLPAILFLLLFGIGIGPVSGWLRPDETFGDLLFPVVSLAVALILFEGGLGLRARELREIGSVLRNLLTVGVIVTWLVIMVAAHYLLDLGWRVSAVLGAILVVTGPTVIGPLLRVVRPRPPLGPILRWEGIVIDPIGASFALLVFEAASAASTKLAVGHVLSSLVGTIAVGGLTGLLAAWLVVEVLKRHWVPDHLDNALTVMAVVAAFSLASVLQKESGLLAVTLMGIYLANQRSVTIKHIMEFKENISVLLISGLFILLTARLEMADITGVTAAQVAFVAVVILVARPLAVLLSTIGSALTWRERGFLAAVAPRGIVAAAVSSVFALELTHLGVSGAERLAPMTFLVITVTVVCYGLLSGPIAHWLGVAERDPQGVLLVGGQQWACAMARELQQHGIRVLLVDSNYEVIASAQEQGIETHYGSILSQDLPDILDLSEIGRLLAVTSNDEVNALACLHFADVFGPDEVYQLEESAEAEHDRNVGADDLRGRELFEGGATSRYIEDLVQHGGSIVAHALQQAMPEATFRVLRDDPDRIPMFLVQPDGQLVVISAKRAFVAGPGSVLISLDGPQALSVNDLLAQSTQA